MPVVNPTPSAAPVEQPAQVQVTAPEYRGVLVDTRYESASSLLTHIEGASWTVNYYQQILNTDSQLSGQQVGMPAPLQQYRLIKELELKVTTELTQSQNIQGGTMHVTGAATVYPFMIPNVGDMFLADVGDGQTGLFQISQSEKKTIFKDTAYVIEYQLIEYLTPERAGDLKSKVVDTVVFQRDFLKYGQNPILEEDEFTICAQLAARYHKLLPRWLNEVLSQEYMTLVVPGQDRPIYDHFLTKAVKAFFSSSELYEISKIRVLNVDDDPVMKSYSLWDAILEQEPGLIGRGFTQAGLVSIYTFTSNPMLEGIRFSGLQSAVYPTNPTNTVNWPASAILKPLDDTGLVSDTVTDVLLADVIANLNLDTTDLAPAVIHPVLVDNYYVFSQAFYDKATSGQSLLELSVRSYLEGKALNAQVLQAIANCTGSWGLLERLYYIPITLMLIRAYVRDL